MAMSSENLDNAVTLKDLYAVFADFSDEEALDENRFKACLQRMGLGIPALATRMFHAFDVGATGRLDFRCARPRSSARLGLRCPLSKPALPVQWVRDGHVADLQPGLCRRPAGPDLHNAGHLRRRHHRARRGELSPLPAPLRSLRLFWHASAPLTPAEPGTRSGTSCGTSCGPGWTWCRACSRPAPRSSTAGTRPTWSSRPSSAAPLRPRLRRPSTGWPTLSHRRRSGIGPSSRTIHRRSAACLAALR